MELLFALCLALAVPSAIGAVAYLIFRWLRPTQKHLLALLGIYFLLVVCLDAFVVGMCLLAFGAFVSKAGAKAHSRSMARYETGWESPYDLVVIATMVSLLAGWAAIIPISNVWPAIIFDFLVEFLILYAVSLAISPSITPFLIWMLQSLVMRPGIDRVLEAGDAAETK